MTPRLQRFALSTQMQPHTQRIIRTVIADSSPRVVRTICSCLQEEPAVQIVGTAADGAAALSLIETLRPDLVLLDLELPCMTGFEVASRLAAEFPATLVVVVTRADVFQSIAKLSKLGVYGIVARQDLRKQLPQLLHRILLLPRF
jgi:DNA-binding NarL/FixJ family response regulator